MKIVGIIQARMGSTRFPNKVMRLINGVPMIELLLRRLSQSKKIDHIILATPDDPPNQPLVDHILKQGFDVCKGSENNVLERFYQASIVHKPDIIVRITGDCPLIDPSMVDALIELYLKGKYDYVSNKNPPTFPDGLDAEVFSYSALQQAKLNSIHPHEREHVTPYIRESGKFRIYNYEHKENLSNVRWTIDDPEDIEVVSNVFEYFSPRSDFKWTEILELYRKRPELFKANKHLSRTDLYQPGYNEVALSKTGFKLWSRAKKFIPGGNMLLSKRPEMFLPNQWPAYFSRAKGCRVWDLDGNEYIDMSIMGIGTNILGYGHPEVDEAVRKTVELGNMSTFNCPEDVYLAEKLVGLHPWAAMARFARSGGEANAIAIRIARAATGKDPVAICGYHGWHDWYMATNLTDETGLDGHLLPGLNPCGVPKGLKNTTLAFSYNNIEELEKLLRHNDVGVIKMEVSRSCEPEEGFFRICTGAGYRKIVQF